MIDPADCGAGLCDHDVVGFLVVGISEASTNRNVAILQNSDCVHAITWTKNLSFTSIALLY